MLLKLSMQGQGSDLMSNGRYFDATQEDSLFRDKEKVVI